MFGPSLVVMLAACGPSEVDKARGALTANQPDIALALLTPLIAADPTDADALAALGDTYYVQALIARKARDEEREADLALKAAAAWIAAAAGPSAPCVARERALALRWDPWGKAHLRQLEELKLDSAAIAKECGTGDLNFVAFFEGDDGAPRYLEALGTWDRSAPSLALSTFQKFTPHHPADAFTVIEAATAHGHEELPVDSAEQVRRLRAGEAREPAKLDPTVGDAEIPAFFTARPREILEGSVVFVDTLHPIMSTKKGYIDWDKQVCGTTENRNYACRQESLLDGAAKLQRKEAEADTVRSMRCTGVVERDARRSLPFFNLAKCEVSYELEHMPLRALPLEKVIFHPDIPPRGRALEVAAKGFDEEHVADLLHGVIYEGMPAVWLGITMMGCGSLATAEGIEGEEVVRQCFSPAGWVRVVGGRVASWRVPEDHRKEEEGTP